MSPLGGRCCACIPCTQGPTPSAATMARKPYRFKMGMSSWNPGGARSVQGGSMRTRPIDPNLELDLRADPEKARLQNARRPPQRGVIVIGVRDRVHVGHVVHVEVDVGPVLPEAQGLADPQVELVDSLTVKRA